MQVHSKIKFKFQDYILKNNGFENSLIRAAERHQHLCPRIVLGVRIGYAGVSALGLEAHRRDKRLLVIVEADGCFISGIEEVTGSAINHRTLRIMDYGKIAATFVDIHTNIAFRIFPQYDVREQAIQYAKNGETRKYFAQLTGYQAMPDCKLLCIQPVHLITPVKTLISLPKLRAICDICGEEVINQREFHKDNQILCLSCAKTGYYSIK